MFKKRKKVIKIIKKSVKKWVTVIKMKEKMLKLFNTINATIIEENFTLKDFIITSVLKLKFLQKKHFNLPSQFHILKSQIKNVRYIHLLINISDISTLTVNSQNILIDSVKDQYFMIKLLQSSDLNNDAELKAVQNTADF